ncbi:MAG: response regulator transcription factor [Elusimicrobia bacterium]|nr:response regulator transcription factor [Elusimicrobiota bacterium]
MRLPNNEAWILLDALQKAWADSPLFPIFGLCPTQPHPPELIKALDLGAEDLIGQDTPAPLLLARMRSSLRKYDKSPQGETLTSRRGHIQICLDTHQVFVRAERNGSDHPLVPVPSLTPKEFGLLHLFLSRQEYVWTRENLLNILWESGSNSFPRTVDKHVEMLRRKLGPASAFVKTVPGVGYQFMEVNTR